MTRIRMAAAPAIGTTLANNTGAIVGTAREYAFKADRYQITADGDHLVGELNGDTTFDIHDAMFSEGHLRLQYQQFAIAFRNLKIRPLP